MCVCARVCVRARGLCVRMQARARWMRNSSDARASVSAAGAPSLVPWALPRKCAQAEGNVHRALVFVTPASVGRHVSLADKTASGVSWVVYWHGEHGNGDGHRAWAAQQCIRTATRMAPRWRPVHPFWRSRGIGLTERWCEARCRTVDNVRT